MAPCFLFSEIIKDRRQLILWISNLTVPSDATWVSFTLLSLISHLMLLWRESKGNLPLLDFFPYVFHTLSFAGPLCCISAVFSVFSLPAYVLSPLLFYFSLLNLSLISHQASFSSPTFWCCCFSTSTIWLTYGWRPKVHKKNGRNIRNVWVNQQWLELLACCHTVVIGSIGYKLFGFMNEISSNVDQHL